MKAWFVYLINGEKVGTWAQTEKEAKRNMTAEYGNVSMEFIGINYGGKFGAKPDKVIHRNMSPVDMMIATGFANFLISLRY